MHHRKHHTSRTWRGCATCKPWKHHGLSKENPNKEKHSDHVRRVTARQEITRAQAESAPA